MLTDKPPSQMSVTPYIGATRWLVTLTVILVAVVEVLDMTIVNVSLPNMMGALGANSEQITWVLTSYIVAAAICMPLTGFLVGRFGQKNLLLACIAGFLSASMLCGIATILPEMVLFRTAQGVFGAMLVPLSQLILRKAFPPEEHGKAMAIWGVGIMVAPVLGPTLGGYITAILNWRWVFFINIPVCTLSFLLGWRYLLPDVSEQKKVDWLGLGLLATSIGCFQIFLDRGNQEDWFDSHQITLLLLTTLITLAIFIIRGRHKSDNIINLALFKDRNFCTGTALITLFCTGILGVLAIQPIMTENIMGYSASMTGIIMAPRGIASALAMAACAGLTKRYDPRHLLAIGMILFAIGSWQMSHFSLDVSVSTMMWSGVLQGFGMGLFFVPLSLVAFKTLAPQSIPEAAGLFSFGRGLGSSIGISILSTLLSRESQVNWNQLGSHIQPYNANLQSWLNHQGWQLHSSLALQQLSKQLSAQAYMLTFVDLYWLIAVGFMIMAPLVYLLRKPILTTATHG